MTESETLWPDIAPGSRWADVRETGLPSVGALLLLVARGKRPGPIVLITGGVHGDEYEGPAAIAAVFPDLDPSKLAGTVVGAPVLNVAAWRAGTRCTPSDGRNLNLCFPGRGDGSETERLAKLVFEGLVRHCDVLLDLHSGGVRLTHLPMVGWYGRDGGSAERLARGFGRPFWPWQLPNVTGVLSHEASAAGKIALGAEWGGGGGLDPEGEKAYAQGIRRILRAVGVLAQGADAAEYPDDRPALRGNYQTTDTGGLFIPSVSLGDRVAVGSSLGVLRNLLGGRQTVVAAEIGGIVAGLAHRPVLEPGDRVAYIG